MLNLLLWAFNLTFEAQVFIDDGFRTYSAVCSQCHLGMNYQNYSDSRVEKKVELSIRFRCGWSVLLSDLFNFVVFISEKQILRRENGRRFTYWLPGHRCWNGYDIISIKNRHRHDGDSTAYLSIRFSCFVAQSSRLVHDFYRGLLELFNIILI